MGNKSELLTKLILCIKSSYRDKMKGLDFPKDIIRDIRNFAYQHGYPIDDDFDILTMSACTGDDFDEYGMTGICIPLSKMITVYMQEVHGIILEEYDIYFYYKKQDDINIFVHRLVKLDGFYYDLFFPEGTDDLSKHPLWQETPYSDVVFVAAPSIDDNTFVLDECTEIFKWLSGFLPSSVNSSLIKTLSI